MPVQNLISSDSDGGLSGPIEVYYGNPALDLGMAAIPKMLARFWTFLASDGEQLNDQEYAVLIQVLSLRETQDYELRAENLPVRCSPSTRERYKARFRRLGLVFTERLFYPTGGKGNPVMRAQRWDLRSLFYNLEHIARVWLERQQQLTVDWEAGGRKGQRPIFNLPGDFMHEVELPLDVAADILRGRFYPVPEKWQSRAEQLLSGLEPALLSHDHSWTVPDSPGSRTHQEKRGSEHRTASIPTGSDDA